jgi:hypothetical protein
VKSAFPDFPGIRRYVDGKAVPIIDAPDDVAPATQPFAAEVAAAESGGEPIERPAVETPATGVIVIGDEAPITDTAGMRAFLLRQMQRAASGAINTEQVKNVCSLAQQVYHATKLELDAARILKDSGNQIRKLELADGSKS